MTAWSLFCQDAARNQSCVGEVGHMNGPWAEKRNTSMTTGAMAGHGGGGGVHAGGGGGHFGGGGHVAGGGGHYGSGFGGGFGRGLGAAGIGAGVGLYGYDGDICDYGGPYYGTSYCVSPY
jgi:hypothetical protein